MSNASTIWSQAAESQSNWWRRTPEPLIWIWVMVGSLSLGTAWTVNFAQISSMTMLCVLGALAAIVVTQMGLREVAICVRRVQPLGQALLHLKDMVLGWFVSMALLCWPMALADWQDAQAGLAHPWSWMLLVLAVHSMCIWATHAWRGMAHPIHMLLPVLLVVFVSACPSSLLSDWLQASLGLQWLVGVYGFGAAAWAVRQDMLFIRAGGRFRPVPAQQLHERMNRLLADAGFMDRGYLNTSPWTLLLGPGLMLTMFPLIQIGDSQMLEPWDSKLGISQLWRIVFLTLGMLSGLRSNQWHWRYWLLPGGRVRQDFGLNMMASTARLVLFIFVPVWAVSFLVKQNVFMHQDWMQSLMLLGLYVPTVFLDFWLAIALAACIKGLTKSTLVLAMGALVCMLFTVTAFMVVSLITDRWQWMWQLGHREWTYLLAMSVAAMMLTLLAQRIWRKRDLAQVWREYEARSAWSDA